MRTRHTIAAAIAVAAAATATWMLRRDPAPGPAERALGRLVSEVRFERAPFNEAVATLGRFSGAAIVLDLQAIEASGFDTAEPVDLRLRNVTVDVALTHVLAYASSGGSVRLVHAVHGDSVVVTTEASSDRFAYARVYDVRDIAAQSPESFPDGWDVLGDVAGSTHALHGRLLVVTTSHGHRQVEKLLDQVRHPVGPAGRQ